MKPFCYMRGFSYEAMMCIVEAFALLTGDTIQLNGCAGRYHVTTTGDYDKAAKTFEKLRGVIQRLAYNESRVQYPELHPGILKNYEFVAKVLSCGHIAGDCNESPCPRRQG